MPGANIEDVIRLIAVQRRRPGEELTNVRSSIKLTMITVIQFREAVYFMGLSISLSPF